MLNKKVKLAMQVSKDETNNRFFSYYTADILVQPSLSLFRTLTPLWI